MANKQAPHLRRSKKGTPFKAGRGAKKFKKRWAPETLVKGSMTKLGWSVETPDSERHVALAKSVKQHGYGKTVRRLNFLKNISADSNTDKVAQEDMNYLKKKYRGG